MTNASVYFPALLQGSLSVSVHSGSLSVSGLVTDVVYIPRSLYIKRAVTTAFFILVGIVGHKLVLQQTY